MAVQNYLTNYVPTEDQNGIAEEWAIKGHGVRKSGFQNTAGILSTDSAGSTYTVLKNVPAEAIINEIGVENDALTSGTSYSIGIYDSTTGLPYAANCYMNAQSLVSANLNKQAALDGMSALTHENTLQPVYILAGHTLLTKRANYDIVLTANTPSSVAGNVTFRGEIFPAG